VKPSIVKSKLRVAVDQWPGLDPTTAPTASLAKRIPGSAAGGGITRGCSATAAACQGYDGSKCAVEWATSLFQAFSN
jgi:hypothetical protein